MHETEFTEAFGRLLTDGRLRDLFAADSAGAVSSLSIDPLVRAELAALKFEDLDAQAEVLLGKRFEVVQRTLPGLIVRLGKEARPLFHRHARPQWFPAPEDALHFADEVLAEHPEKIDPREMNRLRFAVDPDLRCKLHTIFHGSSAPGLQLLFRAKGRRWQEFVLSLQW